MVKLRLKRYGKKRQPSYRIIAIESKTRREARPLEELGYYNPRTKETVLETGGLLKWLRCGAQPTETLQAILKKAGIYEMMKAGEGGVVASIRIPAIAKPEAGISEATTEELAVDAAETAEDSEPAVLTEATDATSDEPAAAEAALPEPETVQSAAEETSEEPKVEEAAEA
ncbi:MAG: 30S ribosomal protein S16 [Thermostichus sp. HHBFW_bins_43]